MTDRTLRCLIVCAVWSLTTAIAFAQEAPSSPGGDATVVLAGGCFWGVEAVFEHVRGVRSVVSGYARRTAPAPGSRAEVPTEAVKITYDRSAVTFDQLLDVFFTVAHDPTSRDRQGPDEGPEYRAVVYYDSPEQRAGADAYLAALVESKRFRQPIVTEIRPLGTFRLAEAFHQNYAAVHPTDPYIVQNDLPKLRHLQDAFPVLYQKNRVQ